MKFLIVSCLVFALSAMVLAEDTLETCSCWEDHKPQLIDGKAMCVGKKLFALKPCNILQAPRCVCDPAVVTGITSDANGTRCSKYEKGVEIKSWPCENADEWEVYKKTLAEKPN